MLRNSKIKPNINQNEPTEIDLLQISKYFFTNRHIILVITLALPSIIGLFTFFIKKPIYTARSSMVLTMESKVNSIGNIGISDYIEQEEHRNKLFLTSQYFKSNNFKRSLLNEINGVTNYSEKHVRSKIFKLQVKKYFIGNSKLNLENQASILASPLKFEYDPERYTLQIRGSTQDPTISTAITTLATYTLLGENFKQMQARVRSLILFLEEQTNITELKLYELERQLVALQQKQKILSVQDVSSRSNINYLNQKQKKADLLKEQASNTILIKEIKMAIKKFKNNISKNSRPSYLYLTQLQRRLDLLRYQKALDQTSQKTNQSEKIAIEEKIQETIKSFGDAFDKKNDQLIFVNPWEYIGKLETHLVELQEKQDLILSNIYAHNKSMKISEKDFLSLPSALQKFSELKRSIDLTAELYSNLRARLQETRIKEAGRVNNIRILTHAVTPIKAAGMGATQRFLVSGLTGFLIAILCFFLRYILIPVVRGHNDLERVGLHMVGSFPMFRSKKTKILGKGEAPMILKNAPNSPEANAIRHARFKIERILGLGTHSAIGQGKIITVCSVNHGEGKTYTCANLAYAFAAAEFKVVLIDLDLSKPNLRWYFPDVLETEDVEEFTYENEVNFRKTITSENLDLIDSPTVNDNVCDFLEGGSYYQFIQNLKSEYDIIIVDTPPVEGHLEPMLMAQFSDLILFVVNQRGTLIDDLYKAHNSLTEGLETKTISIMNFVFEDLKIVSKENKRSA